MPIAKGRSSAAKKRLLESKKHMTKVLQKLPLGIQSFEKIRREDYLYVDKTALVWQLVHGSMFNYLSRPRRFGKSLLINTLQCYFEGKKEVLDGLTIMD